MDKKEEINPSEYTWRRIFTLFFLLQKTGIEEVGYMLRVLMELVACYTRTFHSCTWFFLFFFHALHRFWWERMIISVLLGQRFCLSVSTEYRPWVERLAVSHVLTFISVAVIEAFGRCQNGCILWLANLSIKSAPALVDSAGCLSYNWRKNRTGDGGA